jgi:NADPH2:quinone reductase
MKAIRVHQFGDPGVLKLEDVPDPVPAPGEVLVNVHAIGVNPVDTYVRAGRYGPRDFPFTPGSDCAGIVDSVGPNVTRLKKGDRVYTVATLTGAYAEMALAPENRTFPLPDNLSFEQGAAIGVPYSTAYRALFHRGHAQPAESVLIHGGSGAVGTAAIQLARQLGMTVYATAGTDKGLQLARDQGAHHVLNHKDDAHFQELLKLTNNRGLDLIVELLANANLGKDLPVLSKAGRVAIVGSRGPVEINPRDAMTREADLRGVTLAAATDPQITATHAHLAVGLANGTLTPIVGQSFPLADAPKAHEAVLAPGSYGKIVLIP